MALHWKAAAVTSSCSRWFSRALASDHRFRLSEVSLCMATAAKFRVIVGMRGPTQIATMTASTGKFAHYWQQKLQDPLHFHPVYSAWAEALMHTYATHMLAALHP